MDTKRRCTVVLCFLTVVCAVIWFSGNKDLKDGVLDILLRVTIFFAIFRLAYDDLVRILYRLRGPTGVLIGIAVAFMVISGPSVRVMLPMTAGILIVMGILNTFRRSLGGAPRGQDTTRSSRKTTNKKPRS